MKVRDGYKKEIKLDIHGMTSGEAKKRVLKAIEKAPVGTEKIIVIHGCNNGTVLRDMVRKNVRSPRILDIIPTFSNDGETCIYLKNKKY